jgi:hypothetical protein
MLPETLPEFTAASKYTKGTLLRYANEAGENSTVVVMEDNTFLQVKKNGDRSSDIRRIFSTYEEWLATLPAEAQGDVNITEEAPHIARRRKPTTRAYPKLDKFPSTMGAVDVLKKLFATYGVSHRNYVAYSWKDVLVAKRNTYTQGITYIHKTIPAKQRELAKPPSLSDIATAQRHAHLERLIDVYKQRLVFLKDNINTLDRKIAELEQKGCDEWFMDKPYLLYVREDGVLHPITYTKDDRVLYKKRVGETFADVGLQPHNLEFWVSRASEIFRIPFTQASSGVESLRSAYSLEGAYGC